MYKKKRKRILQVLKQKLKTYFVGEAFLFLPQLLKPKFMIMEEAEAAYVFQLMIMETTFVFLIFACSEFKGFHVGFLGLWVLKRNFYIVEN